ncbi:MAG: dephospho-CoA kinase [Candidatus Methylomirabilales bacterium]
MVCVGLTGGIATGKSTVARMFAERGAAVLDADEMVRELQMPGTAVYEAIVETFGTPILHRDGSIDRKSLGEIVFRDETLRRRLETIVHPPLVKAVEERLAEFRRQRVPLCVVELPLLIEAEAAHRFDWVVVVTAAEEVQVARLMADRGLTRDEALIRIRSQMSVGEKARRADFVIENGGEFWVTEHRVEEVYEAMLRTGSKKT